jgi:thiamine-phosphate pyrophosphorylase
MLSDIRLIAIPSPSALRDRDLVDACRAAEAGGVTSIQVRLKAVPALHLLRTVEAVIRAVTIPVYVNDRADVAVLAGAAGVHVGADDLPAAGIRTVAPRPLRVGVSVGTAAEADDALRADADYWSVGPFHHTPTKIDAGAALGAAGFRRLATLAPDHMPVVAIGGIAVENLGGVLDAGADGVAVISAIFSAPDITRAARVLRDALESRG